MTTISALSSLTGTVSRVVLNYNTALESLDGLEGLNEITGDVSVIIGDYNHTVLKNLHGFGGLRRVAGDFEIYRLGRGLEDCSGLAMLLGFQSGSSGVEGRLSLNSHQFPCDNIDSIFDTYVPSIAAISPAEGPDIGGFELVITGINFGDDVGTVTIGGHQCPILEWTFRSITCIAPKGVDGQSLLVLSFAPDRRAESFFSYIGSDEDEDGVPDVSDNCLSVSNPNQTDTDSDGLGDACDDDDDGDGTPDEFDEVPLDPSETVDTDDDGVGDNSDNCPAIANEDQLDTDSDGDGDLCDEDDDGDGVSDVDDAFP